MSNLGNVLRKLVYSNMSQTGVWGRSSQPLGDFCKIWKEMFVLEKNCFGKFLKKNVCFVKGLLNVRKNVCKNGIKIAFFLPLGHPPGFVYDFEIRSRS